ncbi:glycosyltransferase [Micromonospora sp. LAH09]|uniref:glycosyltransferase n=1 Tax=Micromonospora cabrerizensis TaxID=2911213 RepID=UPI001EE78CFD|nr:glycosyltransferase [Micromonospora cabrerizensis]MCG5468186.1 glycosyltransferase [Micromonospora cabrerizensis]
MAEHATLPPAARPAPTVVTPTDDRDWVVVFSGTPWANGAHRQHALARQMTVDHRVLFVDPAGHLPRWRVRVRQVADGLWQCAGPALLPLGRHLPLVNRANRWFAARLLRRWFRQRADSVRLLWLDEDLAAPVAARLDAAAVVYDATDLDWTFTRRWNRRHLRRALRSAVGAADLVLASSSALPERMPAFDPAPVVLPNGCDPEHFSPDGPVAPWLTGLRRPLIAYSGAVDTRAFDADLVAEVARAHPEWTFLLIGPSTRAGRAPLTQLSNVELVDAVGFADVPAILRACDVTIIPYRVGGLVDYVHPKKCYEYLALGKPVVATPLPALRALADTIALAGDAPSFAAAIGDALGAGSPEQAARRRALATRNSWSARGVQLRSLLAGLPR